MKKLVFLFLAVGLIAASTSCNKASKKATFSSSVDSMSYAIGVNAGSGFKKNLTEIPGGKINVDNIIAGFVQAIQGEETEIKAEEAVAIIQGYFQRVEQEVSETNKAEGEKFLSANKAKEGVKTTESGLQYKVIKEGTGKQPTANSEVKVSYRGTLIDGKEFDKNDSITFNAGQVIKGWTEGLQLMKEGAKYEFVIPSDLAYGPQGAGQMIKPNSTLIFEVELIEVLPEKK